MEIITKKEMHETEKEKVNDSKIRDRGVLILRSYYEAIKKLPNGKRVMMYDAIIEYGLNEAIPDLPDDLNGYFLLIKPNIDASQRRYKQAVKNGKKGGRPPKVSIEIVANMAEDDTFEKEDHRDIPDAEHLNDVEEEKRTIFP